MGLKIEQKTEKNDTSRLVRAALLPLVFFRQIPFPGRARTRKRKSEKRGVITRPRKAATEHYETGIFG